MRKQKKNRTGIIVSVFIVFIMVTSVIGFIFGGNQTPPVHYKGYKFTQTSRGWRTTINNQNFYLSYTPNDVELLELPDFPKSLEIDVTYDPNSTYKESIAQAIFELSTILSANGVFIRQGFTTNNTYGIPIITCADATPYIPVVLFLNSNKSEAIKEENCFIIHSFDENSFLPYADRIIYETLEIME